MGRGQSTNVDRQLEEEVAGPSEKAPSLGFGLTIVVLGAVPTALSLAKFATLVFELRLSDLFERIFDTWEAWMSFVFGPLELLIVPVLSALAAWLNVDLSLNPHWKHVFLLMFLHPFRDAGVYLEKSWLRASRARIRYLLTACARYIVGGLIAGLGAVGVGTIDLDTANALSNFLIVLIPIVGAWLYLLFTGWYGAAFLLDDLNVALRRKRTFSEDLHFRMKFYTTLAVRGLALAVLAHVFLFAANQLGFLTWFGERGRGGLVTLVAFVILFGMFWVGRGLGQINVVSGESRIHALLRVGNIQLGLSMLLAFLAAALVLITNALS